MVFKILRYTVAAAFILGLTWYVTQGTWVPFFNDRLTANDRIANYTFVLAVSTIGLWIVTWFSGARQSNDMRASIEVLSKQTIAMIAAESPRLFLEGFKFVRYDGPEGASIEDPISGSPYGFLRPLVLIKNGGRTHLQIIQTSFNCVVAKNLPTIPIYKNISGSVNLIEASHNIWIINYDYGFELKDSEIAKIQKGKAHLWFYGYATYLNHLTNELVTVGFVVLWDPHKAAFLPQGPKEYVYQNRKRLPDT